MIVTPRGEAKLLDFGLARITQDASSSRTTSRSLTESGQAVGTLPYMAPEVLLQEEADARTDIYGVGILLYEMTTGRRPFEDELPHELMYTILNQPPPDPRVLNTRLSSEIHKIIVRAMEKSPGDRFQTSQEMTAELVRLVPGSTSAITEVKV